jgi:type IV secretion system protein VirB6
MSSPWTTFQDLYQQINTPIQTKATAIAGSFLSGIQGPLKAALAIYVAWIGYSILVGWIREPLTGTAWRLAKAGAIVFFLSAANYNQYILNFFLHDLPNSIASAISGQAGTVGAQGLDHIWDNTFTAGLSVWKSLGTFDFGLELLVVVYWVVAAISLGFGFLVWVMSYFLLALYVAVGPAFVPMYLFSGTRGWAERWLGATLSMVLLQVFVTVVLVVLLAAEGTLLAGVTAAGNAAPAASALPFDPMSGLSLPASGPITTSANAIGQIQPLIGAIVLFFVALVAMVQLPGAAAAIAGGAHFHAGALAGASFGLGAAATYTAARAAARGAASGAAAIGRRIAGTPGPSLSVRP